MSAYLKSLLLLITLALLVFPAFGTAYAQMEHPHMGVSVDVKPGSDPNTINLKNRGLIPVALFGSAEFDVEQVDTTTARFGPMHHQMDGGALAVMVNVEDVNLDGYPDLVFFFEPAQTGLQPGDTTACLHGTLLDGSHFCGHDDVRVIG